MRSMVGFGLALATCKRRVQQRNEMSEVVQPERRRQGQTESIAIAD